MTDSYIDLNVEHYLRNGELKGAVKDLNTIINGEGSNKSLSELVEDLKVALNYANWGFWQPRGNKEGNILPLKKAVIRSSENSVVSMNLFKTKIVYKGNDMYCDLEEFINKTYPYSMRVGRNDCRIEYALKEFSNDYSKQFTDWYDFGVWDYETNDALHVKNTFNLKKRSVSRRKDFYMCFSEFPKVDGLYKIGTWIGEEKPTVATFRKYPTFWDKYGVRGRSYLYDIETNRMLKQWYWEGETNETGD